ncbi:MAG: isocitrate lyase/PEP mutase family protein [Hyphomicrobiaceae bacterium]
MTSTNPAERRRHFAQMLDRGGTILVPGCHDALSAMLVAEAGFEVAYVGSYATAAAALGLPDVGALGLDDLVHQAKRIVDAVAVPVVADAEGGFFEPANIWRTVRAFEQAGVAAIHIEDHAGGKHTDLPQRLIPLAAMIAKLRAALEARTDPAFRIIARTDAVWATNDPEEALRRLTAFSAAGVDLLFPTGASPELLQHFKAQVPGRYVVVDGPGHPRFSGRETAASLVLFYGFSLLAATRGLTGALARYRADAAADLADLMEPVATFETRLGYAAFTARARRYAPE